MCQSNTVKQIVLLVIMCLCLASCSASRESNTINANDSSSIKSSEESSPLDEQAQYNVRVWDKMCEMDGVYYFVMGTSIHYCDQVSGQYGVLCGKPECEHKGSSCNGYVGPENCLAAYDGKIYTIASSLAGTKLYRVNPDGTNREEVRELDSLDGGNGRVYIHRGYVYMSKDTQQVVNGQTSTTFHMYQYELGSNEEPVVVMEETHEYIEIPFYHFVNDEIYMILPYVDNNQRIISIRKIDLSNCDVEELWVGDVGGSTTNFLIDKDVMYIANELEKGEREVRILQYDITKNTMEYGSKLRGAKGEYHITSEYIVFAADISNTYMIMDHSGKIFDEGSFFKVEGDPTSTVECVYIGEDDGALFFQWLNSYTKNSRFCSDMYIVKWTPDSVDVLVEYNYVADGVVYS